MISVVELFSGIGAIRKALNKSNIKYKVNFISEINKNTFKAYQSIFLDKKI